MGSDASSGLKREKEKDDMAGGSLEFAEAVDCWLAVKPNNVPNGALVFHEGVKRGCGGGVGAAAWLSL